MEVKKKNSCYLKEGVSIGISTTIAVVDEGWWQ